MEELAGQEASLRLREQLLQQEKQLVKNQNDWLSRELQAKSEELLQLRKEKGETVANLEGRLAAREQEVRAEWWGGEYGFVTMFRRIFFVDTRIILHLHCQLSV